MNKNTWRFFAVAALFVSSMSFSYMRAMDANAQPVLQPAYYFDTGQSYFSSCTAYCFQSGSSGEAFMRATYAGGSVTVGLAGFQSAPTTQECFRAATNGGCGFRHIVGAEVLRCGSIYTIPIQSQFSANVTCP